MTVKVSIKAKITGSCVVYAIADTKEDAAGKITNGEFEVMEDTAEWDATPNRPIKIEDLLDVEDLKF